MLKCEIGERRCVRERREFPCGTDKIEIGASQSNRRHRRDCAKASGSGRAARPGRAGLRIAIYRFYGVLCKRCRPAAATRAENLLLPNAVLGDLDADVVNHGLEFFKSGGFGRLGQCAR